MDNFQFSNPLFHSSPRRVWQDAFTGASHLSESPTLLLERVDRHHAGIYQCTADNGVREAVHVDIEVTVLCKYHVFWCVSFSQILIILSE